MTPYTPSDVLEHLQRRFGETSIDGTDEANGVTVPLAQHFSVAKFLKEELGFTLYVSVIASHWPAPEPAEGEEPEEEAFEIATVLRQPIQGGGQFFWRVRLRGNQEIPSLCPIFAGADWQEREQYDLVGVRFSEHPDLRRLMMPEDWDGHPLRKEYAIDTPHAPWR